MPLTAVPVQAYAIAATVSPKDAAGLFAANVERAKLTKTEVILRYGDGRWAAVHDFGAIVFIGVASDEMERIVAALLKMVGPESHRPHAESFTVELQVGAPPSANFDRVVVGELDVRTVELITLVVGQSVAMEYYEADVDRLVGELEGLSATLAETGGFRGRSKEIVRFIGRGMTMRNQVVHTLSLLDAPDIVWDSEALDRLHRELRDSFQIRDRYRSLDQKLSMIQDNLSLLVDLAQHRRSLLLEGAVIVLILVEVFLGVYQLSVGR